MIHFYLETQSKRREEKILLIYFQGSNCNSVTQDRFLQQHVRDAWPSADLLFIEKRGITADLPYSSEAERPDCPKEYIQRDSPQQRVDDIKVVLDFVLRENSYQSVIALGGSEGALVAAMYAVQSKAVTNVVLINAGGRSFLDDVLHNIRSTSPPGKIEEELSGFNGFAGHILSSEPFDLEVSNHGYHWWRNVLTIDLKSVLDSVDVPTLIIQAGQDKSVSPEAVVTMVENLHTAGKDNISFLFYPDIDHGLIDTAGISMASKIIGDINQWLRSII